jgi:hypothetical protein
MALCPRQAHGNRRPKFRRDLDRLTVLPSSSLCSLEARRGDGRACD